MLEANFRLNKKKAAVAAVATARPTTDFVRNTIHADPALTMLQRMSRLSVAGEEEEDNDEIAINNRLT